MFDIGGPELIVIILGIIVLFGPKKIPEIAQMIGKGIQKLRVAQNQFKDQINDIQRELEQTTEPIQNIQKEIKEMNVSDLTEKHLNIKDEIKDVINNPNVKEQQDIKIERDSTKKNH